MIDCENLMNTLNDHSINTHDLDITLTKNIRNSDKIIIVLNDSTEN